MLSDVQRTNISAMFDALDATADGLLSRDDFAVRADQMCAGLAPDAASPHHQELQSAYRQAWDELRYYADCDHDGTVTRDEYVAAVEAGMLTDPEYLEKAVLVVSRALFRAADEDGDGILTRDQYVRMFHGHRSGRRHGRRRLRPHRPRRRRHDRLRRVRPGPERALQQQRPDVTGKPSPRLTSGRCDCTSPSLPESR